MAGNVRLRAGNGVEIPLPPGQVYIEVLTSDKKVGLLIFEADGRVFVEQPGSVNFQRYCRLYSGAGVTPAEGPVVNLKF